MTASANTCPGDANHCPAVCFKDVSFSYDGPAVLDKVDFDVLDGEFACMVGPNGGGKTTILKLAVGVLTPTRGQVRIFGEAPWAVRHQVGYTPQHIQFDTAFPITVLEVVLMGRLDHHWFGRYRDVDRDAAMHALDEVGLADTAGRNFADLSGGQRQRVLIARALVCAPRLLILDEPTANVDTAVGEQLIDLLHELNRRMSILMVSHDLRFVSGHVNKVLCVNQRVVSHPTSEITSDILQEVYGADMRLIRHDTDAPIQEHQHD
ncbi:MAG: metal ABC transporter ATP-binding protein [Candidatus Hydrogenedentota bacterium]